MIYVGLDWAEKEHAVCVLDEQGQVLERVRVPESVIGLEQMQSLLAQYAPDPEEVVIGLETERGLVVTALIAAGYRLYAINPLASSRYRQRHAISGAKSDSADARMLADLVRTDRHHHRPVARDSLESKGIATLARAHQGLVWDRQRHTNQLRSLLREFYPGALGAFGKDLHAPEAVAILQRAPNPEQGRSLSRQQLMNLLRKSGRQRRVDDRAVEIQTALRIPQLQLQAVLDAAYGAQVASLARLIAVLNAEIATLEKQLIASFEKHPDAETYLSLPGLGSVLGARILGEFGDDPTRYDDSSARKCFAGTAPVTRASGNRQVVQRRLAYNKHLGDACYWWAFCAMNASPGAKHCYWTHRSRGKSHHQALRALANRLTGILHGCLRHRTPYREDVAWPALTALQASAWKPTPGQESLEPTGEAMILSPDLPASFASPESVHLTP